MAILTLTAREPFKRGDLGYAIGTNVLGARHLFMPDDARFVRALADMHRNESGPFEEVIDFDMAMVARIDLPIYRARFAGMSAAVAGLGLLLWYFDVSRVGTSLFLVGVAGSTWALFHSPRIVRPIVGGDLSRLHGTKPCTVAGCHGTMSFHDRLLPPAARYTVKFPWYAKWVCTENAEHYQLISDAEYRELRRQFNEDLRERYRELRRQFNEDLRERYRRRNDNAEAD